MTTRDDARRGGTHLRPDGLRLESGRDLADPRDSARREADREPAGGAPGGAGLSLPERLYAARERKGVDLYRAERDTKIRARYLAALERGEYGELPGDVYTKGFLRNYALYLGLDPEEVVGQYREVIEKSQIKRATKNAERDRQLDYTIAHEDEDDMPDPPKGRQRPPTGEAEILGLELLGENGQPADRVPPGSNLTVRIHARYARDMAEHRQNVARAAPLQLVDYAGGSGGQKLRSDFARFDRWVQIFLAEGFSMIEGQQFGWRKGDWNGPYVVST